MLVEERKVFLRGGVGEQTGLRAGGNGRCPSCSHGASSAQLRARHTEGTHQITERTHRVFFS